MTLGEKISSLRKERGLTQAELGNELGVTYQAVSKWERDDSMPDFEMISKLAKLFGVSIAHFENNDDTDEQNDERTEEVAAESTEEKVAEPTNQVLGVCTVCGKYVTSETVAVETPKLVCATCHAKQQEQTQLAAQMRRQHEEYEASALSSRFIKRSIIAAVVAGLISITFFVLAMIGMGSGTNDSNAFWEAIGVETTPITNTEYVITAIVMFIMLFTWIFQLFFDGAVRSVTLAGLFFIKLPGIIFSADLDGLIFLIVMKILFFIISVIVFVGAIIITSFAAMVVSLFTFIPVIIKIIRRNEDILE